MSKPYFMMKAHKYDSKKPYPTLASVKLDGMRFFWDGGASRGLSSDRVPYCNTAKDVGIKRCTGLYSQYAKIIYAPDWFLDLFPKEYPLDGELWAGRGNFQTVSSICRRQDFTGDWHAISAAICDVPDPYAVLGDRFVEDGKHLVKIFKGCTGWWRDRGGILNRPIFRETFENRYVWLRERHTLVQEPGTLWLNVQRRVTSRAMIDVMLNEECDLGGEGIFLKGGYYSSTRSHDALKFKPWHDAEAVVTGYTDGEDGFVGMVGALMLTSKGLNFKISSGLTFEDRRNPPRIGTTITYKYRELTKDGIPKEARYYRPRPEGI